MWKLSTCVMLEELPGLMSSPGELELERSLNDSDPKLEAVEVLDVFDVVVVCVCARDAAEGDDLQSDSVKRLLRCHQEARILLKRP